MPSDASSSVGATSHEHTDLIQHCAECNFENPDNLLPDRLGKKLCEQIGHAVVMGTVHALYAIDADQRLDREHVAKLTESLSGDNAHVFLDHFWFALHLPEPEGYVGAEQEWEKYESTRKFVQECLKNADVWESYSRYAKEVLKTDWAAIIASGTEQDREWCIKVHVKFMSPVEEAEVLGALRLAASELFEQAHDPHSAFQSLVRGRAPEDMRRKFATHFIHELGIAPNARHYEDAVDYFMRAFAHHSFWEGHRSEAVLNVIPEEETPSPDELLLGAATQHLNIRDFAPRELRPPRTEPSRPPRPATSAAPSEPESPGLHVSNWMGLLLLLVGAVLARLGLGVDEMSLKAQRDLLLSGGIVSGCALFFLGPMLKKWQFWLLILAVLSCGLFALHPTASSIVRDLIDGKSVVQ